MIKFFNILTIEDENIEYKNVLVRVDYNITLSKTNTHSDYLRIEQSLQTLNYLLSKGNKLILITHLGRPNGKDISLSLKPVANILSHYLPHYEIVLISDIDKDKNKIINQTEKQILLFENLRFFSGEKNSDIEYAKKISQFSDIYVNDAFGVSHRNDASIIQIPKLLPSYAGLLLKKEVEMIRMLTTNPKKPFVAIVGGSKIETKLQFLKQLAKICDTLVIAGTLSHAFINYQNKKQDNINIDYQYIAKKIITTCQKYNTQLIIPQDVLVIKPDHSQTICIYDNMVPKENIIDIGPKTESIFSQIISEAKTILWSGPVSHTSAGYYHGTHFIYYCISQNTQAISIVGGGDTISALPEKEFISSITHLSTGGGALLELVEKGTLPGLKALQKH